MVNAVSGVNFTSAKAMDKLSPEMLQSQGLYVGPDTGAAPTAQTPKKKGGFGHFLWTLIKDAVIIGGLALAARKLLPAIKEVNLNKALPEDAKILEKAKVAVAKAGDWVDDKVVKKAIEIVKSISKTKKNNQMEIFELIG
ncbi:MAG TPA: hypothetical protein PLG15_00975 [Candidatus Gastranaerophilaceae bacterium]|nr:hypothetical protein [Candidatus Gastranaerophilaceae bacterium]HPT40939.1 hypothetical protein [Candidatus Gastranaerophilaceae bacterium]